MIAGGSSADATPQGRRTGVCCKESEGIVHRMDEGEQPEKTSNRIEPADGRWIVIVAAVAISAVLFALLIGGVIGDVLAYVVVFVAGWIVHAQWLAINRYRRRRAGRTPGSAARPRSQPARRTSRSRSERPPGGTGT